MMDNDDGGPLNHNCRKLSFRDWERGAVQWVYILSQYYWKAAPVSARSSSASAWLHKLLLLAVVDQMRMLLLPLNTPVILDTISFFLWFLSWTYTSQCLLLNNQIHLPNLISYRVSPCLMQLLNNNNKATICRLLLIHHSCLHHLWSKQHPWIHIAIHCMHKM